jgi:hypothetical protein
MFVSRPGYEAQKPLDPLNSSNISHGLALLTPGFANQGLHKHLPNVT